MIPGILIDKAVKVACDIPQNIHSLLRCSYSAVWKLATARSRPACHDVNAVCTNLLHLLHLFVNKIINLPWLSSRFQSNRGSL